MGHNAVCYKVVRTFDRKVYQFTVPNIVDTNDCVVVEIVKDVFFQLRESLY